MDTIFAQICPLGGSIVSVRISGKSAFDIFDFFKISENLYKKKDIFFTKLIHNNDVLDEVVIKIFRAPNSFTGEDVIEVDLHANNLILSDFLELISTIPNFRFAKNGEFTKRAFLNGKIDLIKCEGINAIIRAETKQQQKLANLMFSGEIYKKYNKIREDLLNALSLVEANIDFSEEEVPQNIVNDVKKITENLIHELSICISDKKNIDRINNGISIAIIGKPNVGKSTLFNWLAKREIAIVSPIAGTTRDILSLNIDLDGYKVIFYDTAGIHESNDIIEKEGIRRAKDVEKNADLRLYIFDEYISDEEKKQIDTENSIIILNKIDLQEKIKTDNDILQISLLKKQNLDILMKKIKQKVLECVELNHDPIVLNDRHSVLLKQCCDALKNINFEYSSIEIIGEELRIACDRIGQIIGKIYTEDILDNIFSKFCIGK